MNRKGFSLIELLIVIVIIGIIVIIAVPSLLESKRAAQATAAQASLRNIASAQVAYSSKATNRAYGVGQPGHQGFRMPGSAAARWRLTATPSQDSTTVFYRHRPLEDTANPNYDQPLHGRALQNGAPVKSGNHWTRKGEPEVRRWSEPGPRPLARAAADSSVLLPEVGEKTFVARIA
jgi:prepilin-type N-terminal cleavage/methylation domain-containing protein